jgi:NADPH-dependent 2,4-dienoyl-CoA reductase/sulfur reductase-like enzyme
LVRVCVLGGSPAGREAASATARNGAEVTLVEREGSLHLPMRKWPELLESPKSLDRHTQEVRLAPGVNVLLGRAATSLGPGCSVGTSEGRWRFDSMVVCTGTRPNFRPFPGIKKQGVHMLGSQGDFLSLAACRSAISRAMVMGEGIRALQVAGALSGEGRIVTLLSHTGLLKAEMTQEIGRIFMERVEAVGVRVLDAPFERAVGLDELEAVVAGGRVVPCDALAVVPGRAPDVPPGSPAAGPRGGILVDTHLRSLTKGYFSAGGCAELQLGWYESSLPLGQSPEASGTVAGCNAAGLSVSFRSLGSRDESILGLGFVTAGISMRETALLGLEAVETTRTEGKDSACSIIHDPANGRVVGIQLVGASVANLSSSLSFLVLESVKLRTLAYADLGTSTDISLVAETARQALSR